MVRVLARQSNGLGFESRCGMDVCVVCMFVCSEYIGIYVLVKSVEFKVLNGASVRCRRRFRWVPAQVSTSSLDRGSKLRGVIGCVKALFEARNRQPEMFKPNQTSPLYSITEHLSHHVNDRDRRKLYV